MHHGNSHLSFNMHAIDINIFTKAVAIFWDVTQGCSMHIKGYMVISMRHVDINWVTFNNVALSGSMPHGNNYGSLNMYAIDIVCILIDSQSQ